MVALIGGLVVFALLALVVREHDKRTRGRK